MSHLSAPAANVLIQGVTVNLVILRPGANLPVGKFAANAVSLVTCFNVQTFASKCGGANKRTDHQSVVCSFCFPFCSPSTRGLSKTSLIHN